MTDIVQRSPQQELVAWVASPERVQRYTASLPSDVPSEPFNNALRTALIENPQLLDADRGSLYLAILHAAQLGLVPDGRQAAIVVYENRKTGKKEAQLIPMIAGVRDTLAKFGWMLKTSVVYENDEFEYNEADDHIIHRPPRLGTDRGAIQGAYAKATHKDGRRMAEVMSIAEIHAVRDKAPRGNRSQWSDPQGYPRMVEKTPGHRLAKKLPLDPKDRERLDRIAVEELEPGGSADALYGPEDSPAAPQADPQGEEEAAVSLDPAPAVSAPTLDDEPEPAVAGEASQEALQQAAERAAKFVPPTGKYAAAGQLGPKTIGEIMELGEDGARWLKWALGQRFAQPEYEQAVWAFARIFAPQLFTEAMARRELQP